MEVKFTTPKGVRAQEDFPPEIYEKILAHLCLPDLRWCRLVCKGWKHIITQPRFWSLRANTPRQTSSILISPSSICGTSLQADRHWKIYDTAANKLDTLKNPFIVPNSRTEYTLAVDGRLIYTMQELARQTIEQHHIVRNLVTKDFHEIAKPDDEFSHNMAHDIVLMAEDKTNGSFKITTIKARLLGVRFFFITSQEERECLCMLPQPRNGGGCAKCQEFNYSHYAISSIFVKGVFYTLFFDMSMALWCLELYSCDLETGAWSYIDVNLPVPSYEGGFHPKETLHLVRSLGRLFLVDCTVIHEKSQIKITIWEILVTEKKVIKVAKLPKFLEYAARMRIDCRASWHINRPVAVLGCGNHVVILTTVGRNVGWDLLRNCWDELPANATHFNTFNYTEGLCAGLVDF